MFFIFYTTTKMSHYYQLLDWVNPTQMNWALAHLMSRALSLETQDWKRWLPDSLFTVSCIQYSQMRLIQYAVKNNPENMDWTISININMIPWIREEIERTNSNHGQIDWEQLVRNPSIFTYDYEKIRAHCLIYKEELMDVFYAMFYAPDNMRNFEMNPGFNERWDTL